MTQPSLIPIIPVPLTETSAIALEWPRLREHIATRTTSPLGRGWVTSLEPSADLPWIETQHQRTSELRAMLATGGTFDFNGLFDPTTLLDKARIDGAALEALEILNLLNVAERVAAWRNLFTSAEATRNNGLASATSIATLTAPLLDHDLANLLRALRGKIEPDGSLSDDASPELRRIRRAMERQHRAIEDSLRRSLRSLASEGSTQDELITIRGDRFVIPVKAEFRRKVPGVIHGASSSGQTVFVEPLETIEQNNELVRLLDEEQSEIHRILVAMTRALGENATALHLGTAILAEVESHVARARFANDLNCTRPSFLTVSPETLSSFAEGGGSAFSPSPQKSDVPHSSQPHANDWSIPGGSREPLSSPPETNIISTDQREWRDPRISPPSTQPQISLTAARHPLLELRMRASAREEGMAPQTPIPLTIALPPEARQLIISGPNTGGKTVTLKTTGLLALMAQAGIPVPAEEAILPLFHSIYADIGDAQSIERNLSSFSAHVVNLDRISRLADSQSLVLLDELGSATDPEEGAALAVAVASHFLATNSWTCITTHLTSLKVYAANHAGVLNAAVGFDQATLSPTYQLRLGVPGASAGLNIAARLGMSPEIMQVAREQMTTQTADIGAFLDQLHDQLRAAEAERATLRAEQEELRKEKIRLDIEGRAEQKARIRELEQKLETLMQDFATQIKDTVKAIDDKALAQKISRDADLRLARAKREFSEQFKGTIVAHNTGADKHPDRASNAKSPLQQAPRAIKPGDLVTLKSLGRQARVERVIDAKTYEVSIGPMKMRAALDDITDVVTVQAVTPLQAARKRGGVTISTATSSDSDYMKSEINVIGRTADEAETEVARFLDRAFLAGLPRIRIVHGTGMGVLRRTLREYLRQHPHVTTVTEPAQNEGGQGATVVELRQ
ncbi:endonuclease MutS2 [Granulicella aggregans]|uniref:endonuclease MutS2 n=1 Tax=Granulicella aggregans TaxID=474949 RepID=UPI0021E03ABE|nr:Smr/MutS family protein [Granulicella aggregans]